MHAKLAVVDGSTLLFGSLNWTKSGMERNDEAIISLQGSAAVSAGSWLAALWSSLPDYLEITLPSAEGHSSPGSCADGLDNDYDGKTDAQDAACVAKSL